MPIPRLVHFVTAAIVVVLLAIIGWQNFVASKGDSSMGYLSFNRAAPKEAQTIMDFWRGDDKRASAVRAIVITDYVLILVYVVYLCWSISARRTSEQRRWLRLCLAVGMLLILAGAVLDIWQDTTIRSFVSAAPGEPVHSLAWLTRMKWGALMLGVLPLLVSFVTLPRVELVSGFLRTIWTYFPSLLFIFLTIFAFWVEGQGKDIMTAFTEGGDFNYRLLFFFLAIGLWVYVTWYSSRVIFYIRDNRGSARGKAEDRIPGKFFESYPRFAGNACFLVLELAVLQSPLLEPALPSWLAWVLFVLGMALFPFLDRRVRAVLPKDTRPLARRFFIVFVAFFCLLMITAAFDISRKWYTLLALLLIFQVVYFFYINLHHQGTIVRRVGPDETPGPFHRVRRYFLVPSEESGYLKWYLVISFVAVILDLFAITCLPFAVDIGPFPLLLLAFGVLLAFGNLVSAFSVKYQLNFHLVLFLIAMAVGSRESHQVHNISPEPSGYASRPSLTKYLDSWLTRVDTAKDFDVYLVLANGGASRSGYWTASVLGRLEDASISGGGDRFSKHLLCLSGTSGGGVGVATFFALLDDKQPAAGRSYERSARNFLQQDYFTFTVARMLGPDYFRYIFPINWPDRGAALEKGFEEYNDTAGGYSPSFNKPFSHFKAMDPRDSVALPILFVNTTQMQDGNPGLVTNLRLEPKWFNTRIDVPAILEAEDTDISMASGAILGARFPYLSPAGKIGTHYFVDGGYFDNSGAGAVQELLRGILNTYGADKTSINYKRLRRLHFKVLHILNSPVIADTTDFKPVPPIKNDLLSPVLTIVGAYDMQTTVNDGRLRNLLDDIKASGIPTDYIPLSLYKNADEWAKDSLYTIVKKEPAYPMNWFISEKTRGRMNRRLDHSKTIDSLAKTFILRPAPRP